MPGSIKYLRKRFTNLQLVSLTAKDPYWNMVGLLLRAKTNPIPESSTVLLLHTDSAGYTTDVKGHTVNTFGTPSFGAAGGRFGGGLNYAQGGLTLPYSADWDLGSGNFTIEGWIYNTVNPGTGNYAYNIFSRWYSGGVADNRNSFFLGFHPAAGGAPYIGVTDGTATATYITGLAAPSLNAWHHIAAVRNGNTLQLFMDGISQGTATFTGTIPNNTSYPLIIGGWNSGGTGLSPSNYGTSNNSAGVNIDEVRITKGYARYTKNFVIPSAAFSTELTYVPVDNSNTVQYVTPTVSGSTSVEKFAGASMSFNGTTDVFSVPDSVDYSFGTGPFTIDGWFYQTAATTSMFVVKRTVAVNYGPFCLYLMGQQFRCALSSTNTSWDIANAAHPTVFALNTWHHFAVVRSGNTITLYLDGIGSVIATTSLALMTNTSPVYLGGDSDSNKFGGYLEDIRITKGVARYLNNFSVATAYDPTTVNLIGDPYYGQTVLHMHMDGSNGSTVFADQKGNTFTTTGSPTISTANNKFGTSSLLLNASRLTAAASTSWDFSAGTFTVEAWLYPTAYPAAGNVCRTILIGTNGQTSCFTVFQINNTGGMLCNVPGQTAITTSAGAVTLNTWQHFALSVQAGFARLFKDGVQIASAQIVLPTSASVPLYIGYDTVATVNAQYTGYIDELRITKGVARYTSNFTVPSAAFPDYQDSVNDPYIEQSMVLNTTGVNNATNNTFVDSSANNFAVTRYGDTTQGTFSPFSNSGWSNYFNGTTDCLNIAPSTNVTNFGTGDFTIEFWAYSTSTTSRGIFSYGNYYGAAERAFFIDFQSSNFVRYPAASGSGDATIQFSGTLKTYNWYHFAIVKRSSIFYVYVNGVSQGTPFADTNTWSTTTGMRIGAFDDVGATYNPAFFFNGYISNVRIVKGTAVYTGNFVPPTDALTAITNTQLLTCQSNTFKDNSTNNTTVTVVGSPSVQAFSPCTISDYSLVTNGGSMYFDGTGDYLSIPGNVSNFQLNTSFTIECWIYQTGYGNTTYNSILGQRAVNDNNSWYLHTMGSGFAGGGKAISFEFRANSSTVVATWSVGTPIPLNTWAHLAIAYDGTNIRFFLNGALLQTSAANLSAIGLCANVFTVGLLPFSGEKFLGYIADLRIVKGTAVYTAAFTPPSAPLTAITNTQLLLKGQNAAILDHTGKVLVETVGSAKVSTTKRYSSSIFFNGTTDYLILPDSQYLNLGNGAQPFTIECWARIASSATPQILYDRGAGVADWNTATGHQLLFMQYNATQMYVQWNGGGTATSLIVTNTPDGTTWKHYALVYTGGTIYMYIDGNLAGSAAAATITKPTSALKNCIGKDTGGTSYLSGYIEDFRITQGVARYATNFTVPLAQLPTV